MKKLTAIQVARITKPGRYAVGDNCYLQITGENGRSWIFRYERDGRARHVGLGPVALVSLAEARAKALAYRKLLLDGGDPLTSKRQAQQARLLATVATQTFRQCGDAYVAAHEAGWRNPQSCAQWRQSLSAFVYPVIGELSVAAIDTGLILRVLEPIWTSKPETASRTRGRIESILDWAKARGFRTGENPARWRGHLDHLLPARSRLRRVEHFAALPYAEIGAFMEKLRQQPELGARALELLILTACRSGEILGARWSEIDLAASTWTLPAARTKANRSHRVPLSRRAIDLLTALPRTGDTIFGRPSPQLLLRVLQRMKVDATPHGFRSSFRDWCAETTAYPTEVCEQALAHAIPNAVEAAYRRGDLFEKRRRLMTEWSAYLDRPTIAGEIIPLRQEA